MKKILRVTALAALICWSVSCASTGDNSAADTHPRFHEAAAASVIIQFNTWETIYLIRPSYRDNGFIHMFKREELGGTLTRLGVRRDMAVVILGWDYDSIQLGQMIDEWKALLSTLGFQRVVCIHASEDDEIDGSIVLDDSQLPATPQTMSAKSNGL
jgi:hypothetical protein